MYLFGDVMMTYEEVAEAIIAWGECKGIVKPTIEQVTAQLRKNSEESQEVLDEAFIYFDVAGSTIDNLRNECGDLGVTWLMVCACCGVDPREALVIAYNKISKRTGKVVDGQFVKDSY